MNIGKFLTELSYVQGGGHFHVGGGVVENKNIEQFLDDLSIATKNEEEIPMEKYGVDKTDKVEKAANEMIKKGEAANLDEARQAVTEGEPDGSNSETGNSESAEGGGEEGRESPEKEPAKAA